jgi:hypothetical protein
MCRALLTEATPNLPSMMSLDSSAMSLRVTSAAILLPSFGLTRRRKWLATFSQVSMRGRISPSAFLSGAGIHAMRASISS